MPAALGAPEVKVDVAAGGGERGESEAQCVGAECRNAVGKVGARLRGDALGVCRAHQAAGAFFHQRIQPDAVYQVYRVQHIALGLGHFLPVRVAHQAVDIDPVKRRFIHELAAHHDHPRHPKENDVKAGDQHAAGIKGFQAFGFFGPAERGERPQRRTEPGVQHILFLAQREVGRQFVFFANRGLVQGDIDVAVVVIPRRNAVAPPNLPRDAPVLQIFQPLKISFAPLPRHKLHRAAAHRFNRRFHDCGLAAGAAVFQFLAGQVHKPLVGQHRLHHRARAVAARQFVAVRFLAHQQPGFAQVGDNFLARFVAVQAAVTLGRVVVHLRVRREQHDERNVFVRVALVYAVVVEVVRRGDFYAARAELGIHIFIGDDFNRAAWLGHRHPHAPPEQRAKAFVIGMHGDRAVHQDGFRAGGADDHAVLFVIHERITDEIHDAAFLLGNHLQIRNRGQKRRVPVDQAFAAVDQPLFIQLHEHLVYRRAQPLVHGEALVLPVRRRAHAAKLPRDGAARFGFPFPHFLREFFAAVIVAGFAGGVENALHHHLRGDAGVVGAGLPQSVAPAHAVVANQRVHDGVLKRVPHVQTPGHIRRRNHDAVGRRVGARRREMAAALPARIPF